MQLSAIRTDVVGSLLRPQRWREARQRLDDGTLAPDAFGAIELACIRDLVALQESVGLDVVTDGEIGRLNFQDSFGLAVTGFDAARDTLRVHVRRSAGASPLRRWDIPDLAAAGTPVSHRRPALRRLELANNVALAEYKRASAVARKPVKVSLIGPDRISQRFDHQALQGGLRRHGRLHGRRGGDRAPHDRGTGRGRLPLRAYRRPGLHRLCGRPVARDHARARRGSQTNLARSIAAEADAGPWFRRRDVRDPPLPRKSAQHVASRRAPTTRSPSACSTELPHDRFLLEYDSPRAGGFEPLRFVPKGKIVVLGLISTKVPDLEAVDDLKRRIDAAAKYIGVEQLALSPQCGFASDVVGNLISEDDQKRKLERVVETARAVWGH